MAPFIFLLALPFLLRSAVRVAAGNDTLGAAAPRRAPAARSAPGPGLAMTAALGPAALLTTPQGKAVLTKGLVLARGAKKGDPKAKRRVAATKAKARAGDPKAKKELAVIKAAEKYDDENPAEGDDEEEDYEEEE